MITTLHLAGLLALIAAILIAPVACQEDRLERLEEVTRLLSRQLMLQQLYVDEKSRSDGDSGIKQIRVGRDGTKPFYTAAFAERAMASMHDHSDLLRTSGMGEFIAVLNGIEFRTRHNDYKLVMPSTTSGAYHVTEDIPFPEVPPEVEAFKNLDLKIIEMRQWFQAWQNRDRSQRDYRKYFKPILCYLEGAWSTDVTAMDEPFDSDRHRIEAFSWKELQENIRFTSYTGDKNTFENYAYLPNTIMNVTEDGSPVFAQWNYRILCHPIKTHIKLTDFKPVDMLPTRILTGSTYDAYANKRGARFSLNPDDGDREVKWDLLDKIMREIPGKDNYMARIKDEVYGLRKMDVFTNKPLNTAFYHRWYKTEETGANGQETSRRGFADRNLFMAETTQDHVAPVTYEQCLHPRKLQNRDCTTVVKRFSYAIPLEIIWLTPLNKWNPFNIKYKGDAKTSLAESVKADGRHGGRTSDKAYNGTHSKCYYITPAEFFDGKEVGSDAADTTRGSVGVLDRKGGVRLVKASGVRIFLPEIQGLGVLRTRYPIMPVYAEGSPIWKELEALREVVMNMNKYKKYFKSVPPFAPADPATLEQEEEDDKVVLRLSESNPEPVGLHDHTLSLSVMEYKQLTMKSRSLDLVTSMENGHSHAVTVDFDETTGKFRITQCDERYRCFDGHSVFLEPEF
ncbi:uncharacterized protein [Littorina saxatilis]|uniref:Uncharacterized protein n=1 Tax=Littorina saxatilis TaxID=31220 RepID=A0AAN9B7M6_9CAEN